MHLINYYLSNTYFNYINVAIYNYTSFQDFVLFNLIQELPYKFLKHTFLYSLFFFTMYYDNNVSNSLKLYNKNCFIIIKDEYKGYLFIIQTSHLVLRQYMKNYGFDLYFEIMKFIIYQLLISQSNMLSDRYMKINYLQRCNNFIVKNYAYDKIYYAPFNYAWMQMIKKEKSIIMILVYLLFFDYNIYNLYLIMNLICFQNFFIPFNLFLSF